MCDGDFLGAVWQLLDANLAELDFKTDLIINLEQN